MIIILRSVSAVILFCCCANFVYAQAKVISIEQAKVHYTFEVIKHINWPNEHKNTPFSIIIVGNNKDLISAFKNTAAVKTIRDKKVLVRLFSQVQKTKVIASEQIIFITKNKLSLFDTIKQQYPQALIISDGKVPREKMLVSLITYMQRQSPQIKIALNRANLVARGFDISIKLLDFAGTKEDLSEELAENNAFLNSLKVDVEKKTQQLTKLNTVLLKNNEELEIIKNSLKEKNDELQQSLQSLKKLQQQDQAARLSLLKNQQALQQQKAMVIAKQHELAQQKQQQQLLANNIQKSRQILVALQRDLEKQQQLLQKKEKTIKEQRGLLYATTAVIFIILLLSYFVFRLFKIKRRAFKELKRLNTQLYELATTDALTKLYNRRHFLETTQLQIAQLQNTDIVNSLLMFDIDHFKQVNDKYGHAMGDQAIIAVAKILKDNLREYDIVGRLGGEEFAMFLTNCSIDKAQKIAERIRNAVESNVVCFQGQSINLTISIGLTSVHFEDNDIHLVLQRADQALYQAKNQGRNQVIIK